MTAVFRFSAESVTRAVGRRYLLHGVSLEVAPGDVVAIIGRNGAGKTTLLQVLAGRLSPDEGRVRLMWHGREVQGLEAFSRLAFLPHDLFLYPDLTARENLEFFAKLYRVEGVPDRVLRVLEQVGLRQDADRLVRTYSRGMQQRAAIGRLLVAGALVWLLDEPSTGLDEPGRLWLWSTIADHARAGGAVVFSSHDQAEVAGLATRVIALRAGRVVADEKGGSEGGRRAFDAIEEPT